MHDTRICIHQISRLMASIGYSVVDKAWSDDNIINAKYKNAKEVSALQINDRISKIRAHFTHNLKRFIKRLKYTDFEEAWDQ